MYKCEQFFTVLYVCAMCVHLKTACLHQMQKNSFTNWNKRYGLELIDLRFVFKREHSLL